MARSLTARLGLQRWSADGDVQSRADFDTDNGQLETLAVGFLTGALPLPAVAAANLGFLFLVTSVAGGGALGDMYFQDGAAWRFVGSLDELRSRMLTAKGDLVTASAAGVAVRLPVGATTGYVLTVNPADPYGFDWHAVPAADLSTVVAKATASAKGSLYGASAAGTPADVPPAAQNDRVLTSDSSQASGLVWRRNRYRRAFLTMGG